MSLRLLCETYPSCTGPIAFPLDSSVMRALVIDSVVLFTPPSCCYFYVFIQKPLSDNKQNKNKLKI